MGRAQWGCAEFEVPPQPFSTLGSNTGRYTMRIGIGREDKPLRELLEAASFLKNTADLQRLEHPE